MILVLMGVSGVGKTTIGKLLSALTGWKFDDADDYHSEENRQKMATGIPLNDSDRAPWLRALRECMLQHRQSGQNAILACSALKEVSRVARQGFRTGRNTLCLFTRTRSSARRTGEVAKASLYECRLARQPTCNSGSTVRCLVRKRCWKPVEAAEEILARLRKTGLVQERENDDDSHLQS